MKDKELENIYLQLAEKELLSLQQGDAAFLTGVQYGLDLREEEIEKLKEQLDGL